MSLLVDLFGYLSIIVHGLVIVAQSLAVGGTVFLVEISRPCASDLPGGAALARRTALWAGWSALALVALEASKLGMETAVLAQTLEVPALSVMGADFAVAGLLKMLAALTLGLCLLARRPVPSPALLGLSGMMLAVATFTTHAAARVEQSGILQTATGLHIVGAAVWIGGIPSFLMALARLRDGASIRLVGGRFSRISMAGVGCILISAAIMSLLYIGSWPAVYGTAYGVMVAAKASLFAALLLLGLGNFLVVERLRRDPATSVQRMRRFAEVEIGIGFSVFFAAASLTSVPPAIDLRQDRVTWAEIVERNTPELPTLRSPDHDSLAIPALQAKLDADASGSRRAAPSAFTPGSGELPDRNAADIAWSEYNHHWAGLFVAFMGLLGLLHRGGVGWAKHWPLSLLGLAAFLFLRADPEVWPLGQIGLLESLRDVEVLQHRVFVLLIIAFAAFEWGIRTGRLRRPAGEAQGWSPLVFPLLTALGGALLLTHSHAIANVRDQLLIEVSHTPLALAGIAAGWARWLEVRGEGRVRTAAGWVWPVCFVLIGAILLDYREA